jgi:hypothetical protein
MVVSRTPLFVLFYFGRIAASGKAAAKIATLPFSQARNEKYPFEGAGPDGWLFRDHAFVNGAIPLL